MTQKSHGLILTLAALAMLLVLAASLGAILADDGGSPRMVTSLRGENVELYGGHGVYQHDTIAKAVAFRGYDWANLVVCLPLAGLGIYLVRRGQLKGRLLLAGVFTYLAYNYLIGVMGNAYNNLFLVWTALFAVGLWGVFAVAAGIDIPALPARMGPRFPARGVAVYLVILALCLSGIYASDIVSAWTTGVPPRSLEIYTTLELAALELGIMIPLHVVGAVLLWQRKGWGCFLAVVLAFTACITFISLSVGQLLLYFSLHRGSLPDILVPVVLSVVAGIISLIIWTQIQGEDTAGAALPRLTNAG